MTMNHGIVHFEIPASDPEKLSQFYNQLFGWQIEKGQWGEMEFWHLQSVPVDENRMPKEPGAINGGIYRRRPGIERPGNFVNVESVDEYVQKAKGLGGKVITDKMHVPGGWLAELQDPDGNPFGVWQSDMAAS